MNKEQVYVPLLTPDDCKRFLDILNAAQQEIYFITKKGLMSGNNGDFKKIHFSEDHEWVGFVGDIDKQEISLSQLSEMLMWKGEMKEVVGDTLEDWQKWEDCILSFLRSEPGRRLAFDNHVAEWNQANGQLPPCAYDEIRIQQTLELRKELEERENDFIIKLKITREDAENLLQLVSTSCDTENEDWDESMTRVKIALENKI